MAIATPGSTAATSRRASAMAPANPVATAATRSPNPGEVLAADLAVGEKVDGARDGRREDHPDHHDQRGAAKDEPAGPPRTARLALGQSQRNPHDRGG